MSSVPWASITDIFDSERPDAHRANTSSDQDHKIKGLTSNSVSESVDRPDGLVNTLGPSTEALTRVPPDSDERATERQ